MYKPKEKLNSLGGLAGKVVRLLRGVRNGDISPSSYADANDYLKQSKAFNLQAYISEKRRTHEIETVKTMMIVESRHEMWKAGGPV